MEWLTSWLVGLLNMTSLPDATHDEIPPISNSADLLNGVSLSADAQSESISLLSGNCSDCSDCWEITQQRLLLRHPPDTHVLIHWTLHFRIPQKMVGLCSQCKKVVGLLPHQPHPLCRSCYTYVTLQLDYPQYPFPLCLWPQLCWLVIKWRVDKYNFNITPNIHSDIMKKIYLIMYNTYMYSSKYWICLKPINPLHLCCYIKQNYWFMILWTLL